MAQTNTVSAQEHAASFSPKLRKIALAVVSLAFVMDLLDSTIVNIAIPSIKANLGASYSAIQWVVAGYSLAFSMFLVTGGRMGDVYGYKKVFMAGVSGFTLASLLSGVAGSPTMLIVARLLQGSMAALMVPQVMSLMQVMYKPEERGAVNGLFGGLGGVSASLGPVIGGLLIKANLFHLDWRPIFLINVPVGIFGLLMAIRYLPDGKSSHPLKLDFIGTGLITIATVLLVYPLIQGRNLGWPLWTYLMMIAAVPVFIIFWRWQLHKEATDGSPLVLPALLRRRSFNLGIIINITFEMVMAGFFLLFGLVIQIGLGFSPVHAALTGLPLAVGIAFTMATMGEKVIPKLGRRSVFIGTAMMAAAIALISLIFYHYGTHLHSWQLAFGLLPFGIGMGFVFGALFAVVLNGVDPKHAGSASGTLNAAQQVGGAIGVALIGVVFFGQLTSNAASSFQKFEPQLQSQLSAQYIPASDQATIIKASRQCFVDRSNQKDTSQTPASCQQSHKLPGNIAKVIASSIKQANARNFDRAFRWSMIYSIGLLAVVFIITLFLPKNFRPEAYAEL